jgi:hypothetical protein
MSFAEEIGSRSLLNRSPPTALRNLLNLSRLSTSFYSRLFAYAPVWSMNNPPRPPLQVATRSAMRRALMNNQLARSDSDR